MYEAERFLKGIAQGRADQKIGHTQNRFITANQTGVLKDRALLISDLKDGDQFPQLRNEW